MLSHLSKLSGIAALVVIAALGILGMLMAGIPLVRKLAWSGAAAVALIASLNEWRR